jgi:pimeloyl-ACP methyl ester carboxylesterase
MGGTIAQQLIRMRPDMINKTILASTFARLRPSARNNLPYLARRFRQVLVGNIAGQAETVADSIFPTGTEKEFHDYLIMQIRNSNPKIYRQAMVSLAAFSSTIWMRNWTKPVLVVAGSDDTTVTLKNQLRLAAILSNKQLEVIQGAGHALSIDHKEIFNRLMIDFLLER